MQASVWRPTCRFSYFFVIGTRALKLGRSTRASKTFEMSRSIRTVRKSAIYCLRILTTHETHGVVKRSGLLGRGVSVFYFFGNRLSRIAFARRKKKIRFDPVLPRIKIVVPTA